MQRCSSRVPRAFLFAALLVGGASGARPDAFWSADALEPPGPETLEEVVELLRTSDRQREDGGAPDLAPVELEAPLQDKVGEACPGLTQSSSCAAVGDGQQAVFLTITGLARRLIINSTLQHVVQSMSNDGFAVHVYMSLIDKEDEHPWNTVRTIGKRRPGTMLPPSEMRSHFSSMVEKAGGCLMCFLVSEESEQLPDIPSNLDVQMADYQPRTTSAGRNVLRVWKTRQAMWTLGMQAERQWGMRYALGMWARDDSHWTQRLVNVGTLLEQDNAAKTVWSKDCKQFGGVNDKVVLSGRDAAETMFGLYDRFFEKPLLGCPNSERYILLAAARKGLDIQYLPHSLMPSGDAMFIESPTEYCIISEYWCGSEEDVLAAGSSWCPSEKAPKH